MWLQAAFLWLTGNLRIAFLLPLLLAALGTLWCVTDLGARLWTRRIGLVCGLGGIAHDPVHGGGEEGADRSAGGVLDHPVPATACCAMRLRGPDWRMWALGWGRGGAGHDR